MPVNAFLADIDVVLRSSQPSSGTGVVSDSG